METNSDAELKTLTDVIWQEFQQQAVDAGQKAMDVASRSVLYVAKEIVFALSGDVAAADTDDYGMRNDLEDNEVGGEEDYDEVGDDESLMQSLRNELAREKSKFKKSKKKHKKDKSKTSRKGAHSSGDERRDEESERAHNVKDLIKKFDTSGVTPMPISKGSTDEANAGRTPVMNKPSYDILVTNSSRSKTVQPSKPKQNNSAQKYDTVVVRPLNKSQGTQALSPQPAGKSQDIFRPRSANRITLDDSERFAYLVGHYHTRGPQKPDSTLSPFAPFKEMHRATKALIDDSTFDSRSDRESTHPSSNQTNNVSGSAIPGETSEIPEVVDIRAEIEDIQRIILKLEQERAQRRLQEESMISNGTDANNAGYKDPKKAEEIRILIQRLARLSQRHRELKSKNATRSDIPVNMSSGHAVIDLSRYSETETRVPAAL
jgi:hypothetical protein